MPDQTMKKRIILLTLGAAVLPFLIETIMMLVAEPFRRYEPEATILGSMGITAGFAVGLLCILAVPIKLKCRIIVALVYWPIMNRLMLYWGLFFTGHVFDRWL